MTDSASDDETASRARKIVEATVALDLPLEARLLYAQQQCGDDQALSALVKAYFPLDEESEFMGTTAHPAVWASVAAARIPKPPSDPYLDTLIGGYKVTRKIGAGGMGVVYVATSTESTLPQQVAIKILHMDADDDLVQKLDHERHVLAALNHPNIARHIDSGTTKQGAPYLVMEYVDGVAIDTYCVTHTLDPRTCAGLITQLCDAVYAAHQQHIIHRDIKPCNVLVTAHGVPMLLDFGIARHISAEPGGHPTAQDLDPARLFTPRYASPEQIRGLPETVATDVYALGLLLYELVTGESPYVRITTQVAESNDQTMQAVLYDPLRPASVVARAAGHRYSTQINVALDQILNQACHKTAALRYTSAAALGADLTRWCQGLPVEAAKSRPGARFGAVWRMVASWWQR